ncbi:hypothetical protein [Marinobacterium litorale]|uniref:hypothetical protein n=1 Tax=Marinobacterium litorale TaxID=404770 RepID=UPI0012EBF31F|nr:hypothetical protein [Marinobacterium litorale]
MTPCEERGYKVGDLFLVIAIIGIYPSIPKGSLVKLSDDDGTHAPFFSKEGENYRYCLSIDWVVPATPENRIEFLLTDSVETE